MVDGDLSDSALCRSTVFFEPSCLQPHNIFMGVANQNCFSVFDVNLFEAERAIVASGTDEMIKNFGIKVNYFVHGFNLSADNTLYGEALYRPFEGPVQLTMICKINETGLAFSKFGIRTDDDVTAYIAINTFYQMMSGLSAYSNAGQRVEPKAGDVFQLISYGDSRPCPRAGKFFEVTEKVDTDISEINPLMGSYVWRLKSKRFEYSFEPGLLVETQNGLLSTAFNEVGNRQVHEGTFTGPVSSVYEQLTANKSYPYDINTDSRENVYDQSVNNTDIYGIYYS